MKRSALILLLALILAHVSLAAEVAARNGATATANASGEITIRFAEKKEWPPAVGIAGDSATVSDQKIVLSFEAKSSAALPARLVISDFEVPYGHLCGAEKLDLGTAWKKYSFTLTVKAAKGAKVNLPLFVFDSFPTSGEVQIRNIATEPAR